MKVKKKVSRRVSPVEKKLTQQVGFVRKDIFVCYKQIGSLEAAVREHLAAANRLEHATAGVADACAHIAGMLTELGDAVDRLVNRIDAAAPRRR